MYALIDEKKERELFQKITEYYRKLYPDVVFDTEERILSPSEIGEIYYTYPGEEQIRTFKEIVEEIKEKIEKYNYSTPIILLQKGKKKILIDGHRRVKVAFSKGLSWKALVIIAHTTKPFGIEKLIEGKVKDIMTKPFYR